MGRSLRAVYSIAVGRRGDPGRKLLVWMGFGWPVVHGREEHKDTAFSSLVELSTRIREARMVISEVTARTEPAAFSFNDLYKDNLAGVRTPSELEEPDLRRSWTSRRASVHTFCASGIGHSERWPGPGPSVRPLARYRNCVEDARVFYTISFDPPHAAQPDEYHDLKVQIGAPGLSARTSTGYYDQPVFYDQPRFPARRVSVQELEQILDKANGDTTASWQRSWRVWA